MSTTPVKRNSAAISLVMQKALMANHMNYDELAALSGLHKLSVAYWIKQMRPDTGDRAVFIEAWGLDSRGRLFVPRFRWGNRKDADRPGPQTTSTQRMQRSRARRKGAADVDH